VAHLVLYACKGKLLHIILSCAVERQREKRMLTEEIVELRRERDSLSLENSRKTNQLEHTSSNKEQLELQLLNSEEFKM